MPEWLYDLLFSWKGRIDRKQWWLAFAIITAASIAGSLFLFSISGHMEDAGAAPDERTNLGELLWGLLWLYPMTAITVKRFADRGWPGWPGYLFGALSVCDLLAGAVFAEWAKWPLNWLSMTLAEKTLAVGFGLFALALLIDNGFLPSRQKPAEVQA